MGEFISNTDWDRIREFADTPTYERSPDQLVPGTADGEHEDADDADRTD